MELLTSLKVFADDGTVDVACRIDGCLRRKDRAVETAAAHIDRAFKCAVALGRIIERPQHVRADHRRAFAP